MGTQGQLAKLDVELGMLGLCMSFYSSAPSIQIQPDSL